MSERIRAHVGIIVGCLDPLTMEERQAVLEEASKKLLNLPCKRCVLLNLHWCDGGKKNNGTCMCACHNEVIAENMP